MTGEGLFTILVLTLLVAALISRRMGSDVAFLCALAALLVGGVLEPTEAVHGFANPAVITVALLYIVAQGLKETGGMATITRQLLGRPRSLTIAQIRLIAPVSTLSAFINNTPVVAMLLPVLHGWARRSQLSASQLFMPLSFAAMLGGMCTLIGTSTNLVVNELIVDHVQRATEAGVAPAAQPFSMFTLALVGVPILIIGSAYLLLIGPRLLRADATQAPLSGDPREYSLWMRIDEKSPLSGQSIELAGLRHLEGLFLTAIDRGHRTMVAVSPQTVMHPGDRLQFCGDVDSVVELQQMQGLTPDTEQIDKLDSPRFQRRLVEAVVSDASPLVGRSVRDGHFRNRFGAVIIAVHRSGERVLGKIGDIVLRPGDTLLLEAPAGFADLHRNSNAFYLVSERGDSASPRWSHAWIAVAILAALVAAVTTGALGVMTASLCAAMAMIITRCCTGTQARRSVDWQVLIVIGAAFGVARAMEKTGVAQTLAEGVLAWSSSGGLPLQLGAVYLLTVLLTSVMTNNAAAALVFPIALTFATESGAEFMPFAVCIAVGASAAFASPIGYQTNMMVMGPGGYSWGDFLRVGGPLVLLVGAVCVLLTPLLY